MSATSLCSHPTSSYDIGQMAPQFLLNSFTQELDCLKPSDVSVVCCRESDYFTIQVYFKLGLQGTAISDRSQMSQPKCHLEMERGDHSLRQHKGSLRNQNYILGGYFVHVLSGAQDFVLVGYSMWGAKALAHGAP